MASELTQRKVPVEKDKKSGTDTETDEEKEPTQTLLVDEKPVSRWRNWVIRGITTWIMLFLFAGIIYLGHLALAILVVLLQLKSFHEIISIAHIKYKEQKLPWFRTLNWYFLFCANYFMYFEGFGHYFLNTSETGGFVHELMIRHRFISFSFYIAGFVAFVLTLKRGYYKFQFSQFGWTHIALLLIVTQSQLIMQNIYDGLVWFLLPASMIICNDVMAYMFGFFFGRTRLITLSPKKTWEGFIGALFSTVVFAVFASQYLASYDYFICPVQKLSLFDAEPLTCDRIYVFTLRTFDIPQALQYILTLVGFNGTSITIYPIVYHALLMSVFSSVIAPFGGFFASGVKRAFLIKDFDNLIPGHGGITDRMDCQLLMATFAFIYHESFIKGQHMEKVFTSILALELEDQLKIFEKLKAHVETLQLGH